MLKLVERLTITIPLSILISNTNVSFQDNKPITNITINNVSIIIT